jgi:mycothiol S-conjugate amidase
VSTEQLASTAVDDRAAEARPGAGVVPAEGTGDVRPAAVLPGFVPPGRPAAGEALRLLHVHAHPDDESSKGAAVTAKYVAEGVEVTVVSCTGGEAGSILNPAMDSPEIVANLPAVRNAEMAEAARILGIDHIWLGYVDSGLPEGEPLPPLPEGCFALVPLEESTRALVEIVRRVRPHVLTTYDEAGGYPHPDHIRCHEVSVAAFDAAGDPAMFPETGPAWQPAKLYYHRSFSRSRIMRLHDAAEAAGIPSPWADRIREWMEKAEAEGEPLVLDTDAQMTTRVRCSDYFDVRDRALLAHRTQIDPHGGWFGLPLEIQAEAWPTEDFQLARSLVATQLPEDDLFTGVA